MNTTEIDKLISIKKKSDASIKNRQNFLEEWLKLAKTDGLNTSVIKYLYEGFSFRGAFPLVTYFHENEAAINELNNFLTTSDYAEKNKIITFKMLLHILALLLKTNSEKNKIMEFAIKNMILYCNNKGALTDNKILKKYFIQELLDIKTFPFIDISSVKTSFKSFFEKISKNLSSIIDEKETTEKENAVIILIRDWLSLLNTELKPNDGMHGNIQEIKSASAERKLKKAETPDGEKELFLNEMTATGFIDSITDAANKLKHITENLQNEKKRAESTITKLQNELMEKYQLIQKEKELKQVLISELSSAKEKIFEFSDLTEKQKNDLSSKDAEIRSIDKHSDILRSQIDAQKDIILNKISGDLKIEYKDFLTAVDCPMDIALGENMRDQLKAVFSILKKHEIKFE
ncbi:MAG: hypothetical protein FWH35_00810 [Treponema sp.]|nr:hypothetical protein [Treponema sp.]